MPQIPEFTKDEQAKLNQMYEAWMENDFMRKTENFRLLNQDVKPGSILFVGDSITEGYPLFEMFPFGYPIYNRGISGETSKQLLDRIHEQILDLKPAQIFLLIGTNDIEREKNGDDVGKNIKRICEETLTVLPDVKIHVISVYPVNETSRFAGMIGTRTNQKIVKINEDIKAHIQDLDVTYIDLYDALLKDGHLNESFTNDGLHLTVAGYRFVSKAFLAYFK